MSEILRKVTSRKFIMALLGVAIGYATAMGVEGSELVELAGMIGGIVTAVGSVLGYINGEARVDAARASCTVTMVQEEEPKTAEGFK